MSTSIHFDDALPVFAALVQQEWGVLAIAENIFLRDVIGRLTFVVLNEKYSTEDRATLASKAATALGRYVDGEGFAVATPDELFDDRLKEITKVRKIHLNSSAFTGEVLLIDRRMVGADWLRDIAPTASPPLRLVFASIKGGVGRSTTLCVLAAHLAAQGRRVLAIDMDLEAPGLGNMLLPGETLPAFGLLDYLVEQSLGPLDNQFYADMVGSSWLGGGRGRVDVVPAIGQRSLLNPANVLAKIARAYLDGGGFSEVDLTEPRTESSLAPLSFMDHMRYLIERLATPLRYDVILIDARAGLHETTATAVVGLGAKVLFFGLDQPQTFAGYELLFSHLATLPIDPNDDWRSRLQFIQAKAPESEALRETFSQNMRGLMQKHLWSSVPLAVKQPNIEPLKDTFEVEWAENTQPEIVTVSDDDMPEPIMAILDDARFSSFNPLTDRDSLKERVYSSTFGDLLAAITTMVDASLVKG
jgi:hypothetical protein